MQNFNLFKIEDSLKDSINRMKFKEPTPIQNQAIPVALEGKDILNRLDTVREKLPTLFTKLINHSNDLCVLVDGKDELEKERFFKDEHKQMVTMLSEYLSEYNTLKQQIFKLIIEIKKSDKPKRLLN